MAKVLITQFIDDLDGAVLGKGDGSTVRFSLNGQAYEIDLSRENEQKLRDALAPFIAAGRSISVGAKQARSRTKSSSALDLAAVRVWAASAGHTVSSRGRIPAHILEAYEAAHA